MTSRRRALSRSSLPALGVVLILLLGAAGVAAQDGTGQDRAAASQVPVTWSVRPVAGADGAPRPNFVLEAEPGQTVTDRLVVTNDGRVELVLGVYVSDAFNTPEGETDLLAGDEPPTDIGAWTTTETSSVTVPAGATVEVPFTIDVPDDASAGDHVGGIVTSLTVTEEGTDGNRVKVERRLGSRIYLRVDGELRPELTFTDLSAEYHASLNPFAPGTMELTSTVENTGNVRLRATRLARVATGLGFEERVDEAADMQELLPDNSYTLTQRVPGVWPGFSTTASVELEPYDASGEQLRPPPVPVTARTQLSLVPVPAIVLLALFVVAILVALLVRGRSRRRLSSQIDDAVARALDRQADAVTPAAPPVPPGGVLPADPRPVVVPPGGVRDRDRA